MELKILKNHDPSKIIGKVTPKGNYLEINFIEGFEIERSVFFETFGNCNVRWVDDVYKDGKYFVKKASILAFSVNSTTKEN